MSFTTLTSTLEKTKAYPPTVYLSPTKRKRPSPQREVGSSIQDIYNWTFHSDAIAKCSVGDVLHMRASAAQRYSDFYWLGSVPCRSVKVVGMLVGVQVYEKRILYTVDDGTGVIDCYHAQPKEKTSYKSQKQVKPESVPPSTPAAKIGNSVEVTGIVREVHDARQLNVTHIQICSSRNEELLHARAVRFLHQNTYCNKDPFIIPHTVFTPRKLNVPVTPSTMRPSPPSSVSSSPIKSPQADLQHKSPIKLRHPSRLHTHDLTENTFRIYVKHYMDNAPITRNHSDAGYYSDSNSVAQIPSTPTKRSRNDQTPRQSTSCQDFNATPRPRIQPLNFGVNTYSEASSSTRPPEDKPRKGVSLSFLRRVPELSLLAEKIVQAVGRRRLREEKQKLKDAGVVPSRTEKARILALATIPQDKLAGKKKRLFQWAIIQLLKEGCIVHWDGPVRSFPETSFMDTSRHWKTNTTSILTDDSNLFSTTGGSISSALADNSIDDGALSDPDPNEEAYISLTSDYLAEYVEKAITVLVDHYEKIGKPYAGATKEGILSVLRKDDRWRYVGEWNIEDALDLLRREGKVWSIAKGRWDLTG